jgi:hypothetical protein
MDKENVMVSDMLDRVEQLIHVSNERLSDDATVASPQAMTVKTVICTVIVQALPYLGIDSVHYLQRGVYIGLDEGLRRVRLFRARKD